MEELKLSELMVLFNNLEYREEMRKDIKNDWRTDVARWNADANDSESDEPDPAIPTGGFLPLKTIIWNHYRRQSDSKLAAHVNIYRHRDPVDMVEANLLRDIKNVFRQRLRGRNGEFVVRSGPRSIKRRKRIVKAFKNEIAEDCEHLIYRTHNEFGVNENEENDFEYFLSLLDDNAERFEDLNQVTVQMKTPITLEHFVKFFELLSTLKNNGVHISRVNLDTPIIDIPENFANWMDGLFPHVRDEIKCFFNLLKCHDDFYEAYQDSEIPTWFKPSKRIGDKY